MLNPRQRAVLAALERGPVDPASLADRLELPPGAVVGHVEALRERGFGVERRPEGFVLESVPDYGEGVRVGLDAPFAVEYHDSLSSTNDRARELADRGASDVSVLAGEQTAGRGRRGRAWASPPGGVYASVLLRPALQPERVGLLALAGAVAAVDATADAGVEATIKWPNDVLGPDGRKLAGVLAERGTAGDAVEWVAVGVGHNADVDPADLPEGATSLRELTGGPVDRRRLAQALLESFDALRRDPDAVLPAWRARASTPGRRVRVETRDGAVEGTATDIEATGALLVETGSGLRRVTVGDCRHLRRA